MRRPGGYDRLEVETLPDPRPKDGEVCVDVAAAGVNFADCVVRMGLYRSSKEFVGWPVTPGFDVAGTDADGTDVMAVTRFGGYASRVCVPRHQVFERPAGFGPLEAAAFPTVFLTAYYALFEMARPRPGSVVLVHSAAGGVGGALLQLARIADVRVVGVAGPGKAVAADAVIERSRGDLWEAARQHAPDGYDAIFDANGAATLRQGYRHLRRGGRLVCYGFASMLPRGAGRPSWPRLIRTWLQTPRFNPLSMAHDNKSVMAFNLSYMFDRRELLEESMGRLLQLAREGRLAPPPVTAYPLERVADAHRDLESGRTTGKLVLTTREPEA